jgi:hypothetical protein
VIADQFSKGPSAFRGEGSCDDGAAERQKNDFQDRIANILSPSHARLPLLAKLYHTVLGMPVTSVSTRAD